MSEMNQQPANNCADGSGPGLIGFARLAKMVFDGVDLGPINQHLFQRISQDPNDANALLDSAFILQILGQRDLALTLQHDALAIQRLYHLPAAHQPAALQLLVLCAPGDLMANTPIENMLVDSDIDLTYLYLVPGEPAPNEVPEHDLLFVGPAESDANQPLLEMLDQLMPYWPRPALNQPSRILQLARNRFSQLLSGIPGVLMPPTVRVERATLAAIGGGTMPLDAVLPHTTFPIIARPVGSHAGHGLEKLDTAATIASYLDANPELEFSLSPFVDYRGTDGMFRKARIAVIEGQPFACHMAISSHWMVHYLNAGMTESADKRAEEARFMERFDQDFGQRHAAALAEITTRLGLDYYAIDCAETLDGALLIFEVDTAMVVHAMDPVDMFPYKQPQMRKVFAAFRRMLLEAAQRPVNLPAVD